MSRPCLMILPQYLHCQMGGARQIADDERGVRIAPSLPPDRGVNPQRCYGLSADHVRIKGYTPLRRKGNDGDYVTIEPLYNS